MRDFNIEIINIFRNRPNPGKIIYEKQWQCSGGCEHDRKEADIKSTNGQEGKTVDGPTVASDCPEEAGGGPKTLEIAYAKHYAQEK